MLRGGQPLIPTLPKYYFLGRMSTDSKADESDARGCPSTRVEARSSIQFEGTGLETLLSAQAACAWVRDNANHWANAVGHASTPGGSSSGNNGRNSGFLFGLSVAAYVVIGFIVLFLLWRMYTTCRNYWRRLHGAREELERKRLERLQRAVDAVQSRAGAPSARVEGAPLLRAR